MKLKHLTIIPFIHLLTACPSEDIKQYKVAKEVIQIQKSNAHFRYQTPSGWQEMPKEKMRQASFKTENTGDVSVIMLPGKVGNLLSNVNRWRGQVNLPPIKEEALKKTFQLIKMGGEDALRLKLESPDKKDDKAMNVVLLKKNNQSWFFKLTGSRAIVKKDEDAFQSFLKSIEFKETLPQGNPFEVKSTPQNKPSYTLPPQWKEKAASQMRLISIDVASGKGDLSVISLPGSAGDLLGNINRWRGQVGLAPVKEEALKSAFKLVKINTEDALLLKLNSPEGKPDKGMLVALLERNGQSWFFKLTGTKATLQSESEHFAQFLQSISWGDPPLKTPQVKKNEITYTAPKEWQEMPATGMRQASFKVQGADISIVALAGDGGNLLSNINRWRGQLGLTPAGPQEIKNSVKDLSVDGAKGYYLSLNTDKSKKAMLIAALQHKGKTWFIKLSGTPKLAAAQEANFKAFIKSLRFQGDKS